MLALGCLVATVSTAGWGRAAAPEPLPVRARAVVARTAAPGPAGVVAPAARPARLLPPVSGPASTAYAFEQRTPQGQAATYDPCRAVHYVVSRAHLTPARGAAVTAAFRTVSAATGLVFVDDGTTDEAVSTRRAYGREPGGAWTPVLVGWATGEEYPPLAGDVVGLGGSTQDRHGRLVSGQVALDVRGPAPGPVLLHELGHLVGLTHVADRGQLMAPVATGRTTYGPGDLAGLAAAGDGTCEG